eukprot:UN27539
MARTERTSGIDATSVKCLIKTDTTIVISMLLIRSLKIETVIRKYSIGTNVTNQKKRYVVSFTKNKSGWIKGPKSLTTS